MLLSSWIHMYIYTCAGTHTSVITDYLPANFTEKVEVGEGVRVLFSCTLSLPLLLQSGYNEQTNR